MDMSQATSYLTSYAKAIDAPIQDETRVISVDRTLGGYVVTTTHDIWRCVKLVIASGACNLASVPKFADAFPNNITQLTPLDYKSPDQLENGGVLVVGASATGVQLAREIQVSGRQVTLAAGEHVRMPRTYRGHDIQWWMEQTGILNVGYTEVDDITRARKLPSMQLVGSNDTPILDINALLTLSVEVTGRVAGLHGRRVQFSGSLANVCSLADLKINRLLVGIDQWILDNGRGTGCQPHHRFEPTTIDDAPRLDLDLSKGEVKTVIWATGFRPDYSWLKVPVLDRKGRIKHDGGIVNAPGMYVLGLPFLRKRKSTLIDGVGEDAEFVANHLGAGLHSMVA